MEGNHEALLKTALRLQEHEPLPTEIVERYWEVSRTFRRLGETVRGQDLAWIAILAGRPVPKAPTTILDVIKDGQLVRGGRVLGLWRDEWKFGRYVKSRGKKVIVVLDEGPPEEREFGPTEVRIPDRNELSVVG
jgi:hypothetical protein